MLSVLEDLQAERTRLAHEVRQRRAAEADLKRLNEELDARVHDRTARVTAIMNTAADGIVFFDEQEVVESVNIAAARMFGYQPSEIVGRSVTMLIPSLRRMSRVGAYQTDHAEPVVASRSGGYREYQARRRDGSTFSVDLTVGEATFSGQRFYTAVLRDATDRKATEARLRESAKQEGLLKELHRSNEELQQFADALAHDLREPLRAVRQHCQLIRDAVHEDDGAGSGAGRAPELAESLEFVLRGADRMWAMVEGLLEYCELSKQPTVRQPVPLGELMREVTNALSVAIEESQGSVTWDELPTVVGDPRLITRLLQNLVSNALRYHRPDVPPEVHVTGVCEKDTVTLSVRDNGIGIEPQYHKRIFELYRRLHTAHEYPGHGLGLTACEKIARTHGGHIRVDSAPGRGSTFHVHFAQGGLRPEEKEHGC